MTRIWKIWEKNIWLDEGHSIRIAESSELYESLAQAAHPPLYYIVLRGQLAIFGYNEIVLRLFSVFTGVGTVIILYKIGELIFDTRVGLFSAVLLSLSQNHIEYSQEIRMYSLFVFLTAISYYIFLKIIYNEDLRYGKLLYVFTTTGIIYTHYYGIFIIATQFVSILLIQKRLVKKDIIMFGGIVTTYIPGLILLSEQISGVQSGFVGSHLDGISGVTTAISWVIGNSFEFLLVVFLAVFLILIDKSRNVRIDRLDYESSDYILPFIRKNILVHILIWNLIIFIGPFIVNQILRVPLKSHYFQAGFVTISLLVGIGISYLFEFREKKNSRSIIVPVSVVIILITSMVILPAYSSSSYYSSLPYQDNKVVANTIEINYEDGDVVLFAADSIRPPICFYIDCDVIEMRYGGKAWQEPYYDESKYISGLNQQPYPNDISEYDRIWYVNTHSQLPDSNINNFKESNCWKQSDKLDKNIKDKGLYLFEKQYCNEHISIDN